MCERVGIIRLVAWGSWLLQYVRRRDDVGPVGNKVLCAPVHGAHARLVKLFEGWRFQRFFIIRQGGVIKVAVGVDYLNSNLIRYHLLLLFQLGTEQLLHHIHVHGTTGLG